MNKKRLPEINPGDEFGKWTAIRQITRDKYKDCGWVCQCECGTVRVVRYYDLIYGKSHSCGCVKSNKAQFPLTPREMARKLTLWEEQYQREQDEREARAIREQLDNPSHPPAISPKKLRAKLKKLRPYKPKDISQFGYDEWMFKY